METMDDIASARSESVSRNTTGGRGNRAKNPFSVPDDAEYFALRDEARHRKAQEYRELKSGHIQRQPLSSRRTNYRQATKVTVAPNSAEEEALGQLILSPDSNQLQDGLRDFIQQKREIFLAQLAIDTKKEELRRLDRLEREEEENLKVKEAEINLFRDQFRTFLESDGKTTMEARHAAEEKAKQRIEVSMQIKQISSQISTLRNEIAHYDEKLQECEEYKKFLEQLTPKDWRKTHPEPEMYFKSPQQLLDIMATLEEQNMFLIRHCQDAEETVERYRSRFNHLLEERDGRITEQLDRRDKRQKELDDMLARNEMYKVTGDFRMGNELSAEEWSELQRAIHDFHKQLGFDAASSKDTGTMLRRIEGLMEEMQIKLDTVSKTDPALLKELAQKKEVERRNQERTEKNIRNKKEQEEKLLKAITLAMMPVKKRTGRPLVQRTIPRTEQTREKMEEELRQRLAQEAADEDLLYGEIWD